MVETVERSPSVSTHGILPRVVSLLRLERDRAWRSFAVDDLVALVMLEYPMGEAALDAVAMGISRSFRIRAGLSLALDRAGMCARVLVYFERAPIPSTLLQRARPILDAIDADRYARPLAERAQPEPSMSRLLVHEPGPWSLRAV